MTGQVKFSLHHVDCTANGPQERPVNGRPEGIKNYIDSLTKMVEEKASKRKFKFASDSVEVATIVSRYIDGESFEFLTSSIANRLFRQEQKAQEGIEHLGKVVKKGSLVQADCDIQGNRAILIAKVETETFLDEQDLDFRSGLPLEKFTYRAAVLYTDPKNVSSIVVYDSRTSLTRYWWDNFLELSELRTDNYNTGLAFKKIKSLINRSVRRGDNKSDHVYVTNSVNNYFNLKEDFDISDIDQYVFEGFVPENSGLNVDKIRGKLLALPEKNEFDGKFEIKKDVVKKKMRQIVPLADNVDLHLNGPVEHLSHFVKSRILDGDKYVTIKSDMGYDWFKSPEND